MSTLYPKSGKKPGVMVKPRCEKTSSVYVARAAGTDTEEKRREQLHLNYYGKGPKPERPEHMGLYVSPIRR